MNKGEGKVKRKKSTGHRPSKARTKVKSQSLEVAPSVSKEIVGLLIMGMSLLVLIGVFSQNAGLFGKFIQYIFVGLFGIGGYMLPIFAMVVGIFYIRGKRKQTYQTIVYGGTFTILLISFFHVLSYGVSQVPSLLTTGYIDAAAWHNGGYVGALLGRGMLGLLGLYGTYILLAVLYAVWLLLVTQFPIFSWLHQKIADSYQVLYTQRQLKRKQKIRIPKEEKRVTREILQPAIDLTEPIETSIEHPAVQEMHKVDEEMVIPFFDSTIVEEEIAPSKEPSSIHVHPKEPERKTAETVQDMRAINTNDTESPQMVSKPMDITYQFPPVTLLHKVAAQMDKEASKKSMNDARKLVETLASFGVEAKVTQIHRGPSVTRYELQPKQGVKVSKIVNLADDIALNLAAPNIRIEAPIPGKAAVGIEVANNHGEIVYLRDVIDSDRFLAFPSKLAFALGKDIAGKPIITDIAKMPHLLIAGATGSGKSVCINTLITSIIYKATPQEVRLIMIDPKVVELSVYNGIPHLMIPVVTDPKKAAGALFWAVNEMTRRYHLFAETNVRDMKGYNEKQEDEAQKLPQIVIIIDELADLMMTGAKEVEDAICRLAQMARAAGIHLVIATQRPSVDVITGVIKANIPSRLAFSVSSGTDSRTILDVTGAEKLLGKGDMLFSPVGESKPIRIQGAYISDQEVESIVNAVRTDQVIYEQSVIDTMENAAPVQNNSDGEESDELLEKAVVFAADKEKLSISMLQRYFRIGFNRAARLMDALEARGVVGPDEGSKPRKVL